MREMISQFLLANYQYILEFRSSQYKYKQILNILIRMNQYRLEYDSHYQNEGNNQDGLEHYRLQISRLQEKLGEEAATYKKRIAQLQGQLYANRKPVVTANDKKPGRVTENLSYELYEKDLVIKQLKTENMKLRQIINNPDKVLIRRPDHFEAITQKQQQIAKLRKTIQELQGKHDGQYLSQHKIKKEHQMLLHQNEKLKQQLKAQARSRIGFNQQMVDPELLEAIRYKKELEACKQELVIMENSLKNKDQELQILRNKLSGKNSGLAMGTQFEDMKMELNEFKEKNRQLNKIVKSLQDQNEKLIRERDRARIAAEQQVPQVARKVINKTEQEENLIRYYQSKSIAMKSLVPPPKDPPTALRKTNRYDQFHFSDWESVM